MVGGLQFPRRVAVALNASICYLKPSFPGDHLKAEATEIQNGCHTSLYDITVTNVDTGALIVRSQDDQPFEKRAAGAGIASIHVLQPVRRFELMPLIMVQIFVFIQIDGIEHRLIV